VFAIALCLAAALCAVSFWLTKRRLLAQHVALREQAQAAAQALVTAAQAEAKEALAAAHTEAKEALLRRQKQGQRELAQRRDMLQKTAEQTTIWEQALARSETQLQARQAVLSERERALGQIAARQQQAVQRGAEARSAAAEQLQSIAGETFKEARHRLISEWVEQARAEASAELRLLEQSHNDPEYTTRAKRILDVASQRYYGHYLTERLLSNLPILPELVDKIGGEDQSGFLIIGEVANVKLTVAEDRTSIRLEGQDSFGREIARRALHRFGRALPRGGADALRRAVQAIAEELERETVELGRKAFKELEIPRAHPDIVRLVGRLNYRTSYSQNQWKHAVEAAFLCGMIAAELRLDVKIARRAALMHDIGKSLTHAIDGSHAVIGADYARRLGESEVVANAIGAHHLDEPFNSPYAYIVAAADAMSGARPGARHEQEGSHIQRLEDLERLALSMPGIDRVYALQAGRELRVHVLENQVSDIAAAQLSSELAEKISENMVFPGQIKVTVIRELTAVAIAN
jgi:ribonuclease Y